MKGCVLFSGGLDSTTVLALALQQCDEGVFCVTFNYGSKHGEAENAAAWDIAKHYNVSLFRVAIPPETFRGGSSALLSEIPTPHMTYREIKETMGPSLTVVPFRNAVMLSIATAYAITHKADVVYAGIHAEDAANWAYPDCTPEFAGAMANAIWVGSYGKVRLATPFQWMTKEDIVWMARRLHAPIDLTWSCYDPQEVKGSADPAVGVEPDIVACGLCPTCVERIVAFKGNFLIDPIPYAVHINWEGCVQWS